MNLLPAPIQTQVNRVDRTRSLWLAISAGLTALWMLYRVFWLLYSATVLSDINVHGVSVGVSTTSLILSALISGLVGIGAALVSATFFLRYRNQS